MDDDEGRPAREREAERLRKDREREEQRARRDEERAAAQRRRDEQQIERDRARAERDRQRAEREVERARAAAAAEAERMRREVERAADEAAREAAAASREAARAAAEAQRAERRAAHHAERAHTRARTLDDPPPADGPRLPPEIAVLWRAEPPVRRGPRPGLTLDDIADAGIAIADAEGLEAVSMARVAAELGYTAMSLYRYVSSKDEVIALMVDRAAGDPPPTDPASGWRARLETLARAQLPGLAAHPWMTSSSTLRNTFGPHRFAWLEALVAALDGTPLSGEEKLEIAAALGNQALADVRTEVEVEQFARRAAERDEVHGFQLMSALVDHRDEHPALAAALANFGPDEADEPDGPDEAAGDARPGEPGLTFGLRLLLDGVAARIAALDGAAR